MICGGPARARVTGTHRGRKVWVSFSREDGCRIGLEAARLPLPVSLGGM